MIQFPQMPATQREAEEHLRLFRERYLHCFPCLYIPPDMTSDELREEKPVTWFTIMMMSCQTSSLQFAMGAIWQDVISQKIVVEHEKSIDLLQGLVIFLGWSVSLVQTMPCPATSFVRKAKLTARSQYHKKDKPYLCIFTQLAISQVYELSLNKLPGDPSVFSCFKPANFKLPTYKERTMEDRRTVLACFYITSQFVILGPLDARFLV